MKQIRRLTMLIAQITDIHLTPNGVFAQGKANTEQQFAQVLAAIKQLKPQPDVLLFTGDIADNKQPVAYEKFRKMIAGIGIPYYLIPGNHDDRTMLRAAFPDHPGMSARPGQDFIQYAIDEDFPVRLIGLDTHRPDNDKGDLSAEKLAWLEEALSEQPDKPTLIFMHHPPFLTGIDEMDYYNLAGTEAFADVLSRHKQVVRIICGHVHRSIQTVFAGVLTSIAPACAFTQALGLGPDGAQGFILEAPKYELHLWNDRDNFISHTVNLEYNSGAFAYPTHDAGFISKQ
ncbi:phosphodiesterase [Kiloniella laminariae]|nr:phosphodiesterase [Kiloniella laminariae]